MMTSFDDGFVPGEIVDVSNMVVNDCKEFKKDVMAIVMDTVTSDNSLDYQTIGVVLQDVIADVNVMARQSDRINEILEGMSK